MKRSCVLAITICFTLMFATTLWAAGPELQLKPLKPTDIKIPKASITAAMDRATGPLRLECKGAQLALAGYNACKDRCAANAQNAPITAADLQSCGNMTAADCANMLVTKRAQACMNAPVPAGCKDEYAKLQRENTECKSCNELKASAQKALEAVQAQAKVVSQAEAALAQARAHQHALVEKYQAQANKRNQMCAAATR